VVANPDITPILDYFLFGGDPPGTPNSSGNVWISAVLERLMDRITDMIVANFERSLSALAGVTAAVSNSGAFPESGAASVQLLFSDGSRLRAEYWRIVKNDKAGVSSFDHDQKYGLPAPIDSFQQLERELQGKCVTDAHLDPRTGDLLFRFEEGVVFHVFNFTGYEVWEIHFPDGSGEYSPHAK
jgi:hypothetical protein